MLFKLCVQCARLLPLSNVHVWIEPCVTFMKGEVSPPSRYFFLSREEKNDTGEAVLCKKLREEEYLCVCVVCWVCARGRQGISYDGTLE